MDVGIVGRRALCEQRGKRTRCKVVCAGQRRKSEVTTIRVFPAIAHGGIRRPRTSAMSRLSSRPASTPILARFRVLTSSPSHAPNCGSPADVPQLSAVPSYILPPSFIDCLLVQSWVCSVRSIDIITVILYHKSSVGHPLTSQHRPMKPDTAHMFL